MSIELEKNGEMSINDALVQIEAIRSQINSMGANDSEFEALNNIRRKIEDREMTPEEAVAQAQGVMDSKQAYH
jgi:flagellar biosynthesis regulator FlbT